MGASRPRRAIFLDRDGVINRNVLNPSTGSWEAPLTVVDFTLIPGALRAMRRLQTAGFLLFLVSNQPNAAKGKCSLDDLRAIHVELCRKLCAAYVKFAAFYYCFHHPEGIISGYSGPCACRKPSPYFLLRAAREFSLDLTQSWMIGDRSTDILCGRAAGTQTILIRNSSQGELSGNHISPDYTVIDLADAADLICGPPATATPATSQCISVQESGPRPSV